MKFVPSLSSKQNSVFFLTHCWITMLFPCYIHVSPLTLCWI